MRTRVVANPQAGSAADLAELRAAVEALPAELCLTEEPGHAERLAREAVAAGCERVVAAGGDGTLNEVVNGLAPDFGSVSLGLLPLGTGNDFARSIGVPPDLPGALAVLAAAKEMAVDLGRAALGGAVRHFVNVSAGGFSGVINEKMDSDIKRAWGPLSYLRCAVEALPELAPYRATIRLDGDETLEVSAYSVLVANARYVASGIPVAPEARLDDGLLDLMIIPEATVPQLAVLLPQVLLGRHLASELVLFRRAAALEIRSEPPMCFNADGEPLGDSPVRFEVLPRALRAVVGELAA